MLIRFGGLIGLNTPRYLSTMSKASKNVIGLCQMLSTNDKIKNRNQIRELAEKSKGKACFLFFPECCDYIGRSVDETLSLAESLSGETVQFYQKLCSDTKLWMSFGGIHESQLDDEGNSTGKVFNTHIIINDKGEVVGIYRKLHLFDVDTPDFKFRESKIVHPGPGATKPVETPIGKIGMQIVSR